MKNKLSCPYCHGVKFIQQVVQKNLVVIHDNDEIEIKDPLYPVWSGFVCRQCKTCLPKCLEDKLKIRPPCVSSN
jgi:hypothetical protein